MAGLGFWMSTTTGQSALRQSHRIMALFPLKFSLNCQIRSFEMEANLSIVFNAQALQGPKTVFVSLKRMYFSFLLNS